MNNNDIVKELQTRGYDAELHEVIKNGVSMKGIVIRSNDPMTPILYTDDLIEMAEDCGQGVEERNKNLSGLNPVISGCKRYDMKNQEIIAKAAIKIGLLTVEEAERRLRNGEDIPLHTIQGWRLRGNYKVKDDAEPVEVKLWKKQEDERFYLAKAYLYSEEQVQRIE